MLVLDATEEQLDFPTIYGSAKQGWMSEDWKEPKEDITAVLDAIIKYIPEPKMLEGTPQMLITSLDYSKYVGRIAVGRVHRGELKEGQDVMLCKRDGSMVKSRIKEVDVFEGLGRTKVDSVQSGDICAIIGIDGFEIGETIADVNEPEPLPTIAIDEPTMSMLFTINNSPFFGKDGKFVTSRHIFDRLQKELDKNLALRVVPTDSADSWLVYGRGVLHLSVLIETMRREGYELQVGQPQVIIKEIDGEKCEPVEQLTVNLPEECSSRIIGLNNAVLTASAGEAIMAHRFLEYQPWKGDIERRMNGSIIAMETGQAFAYALNNLQSRGRFFIAPGEEVYAGQVVGEHTKDNDLVVNVTKSKKLTNMRASGSDDKVSLAPPIVFSLEDALEYIKGDEYVEITPNNMRMRKIILDETERKRQGR